MVASKENLESLKIEAQRKVELLNDLGRKIRRVSELCDSLTADSATTACSTNGSDAQWRELFHLVREVQQENDGPQPFGAILINEKLPAEILANHRQAVNEAGIIAQVKEIRATGGLELSQFFDELEKIEATHG